MMYLLILNNVLRSECMSSFYVFCVLHVQSDLINVLHKLHKIIMFNLFQEVLKSQ